MYLAPTVKDERGSEASPPAPPDATTVTLETKGGANASEGPTLLKLRPARSARADTFVRVAQTRFTKEG